jgi:hypothetical protein
VTYAIGITESFDKGGLQLSNERLEIGATFREQDSVQAKSAVNRASIVHQSCVNRASIVHQSCMRLSTRACGPIYWRCAETYPIVFRIAALTSAGKRSPMTRSSAPVMVMTYGFKAASDVRRIRSPMELADCSRISDEPYRTPCRNGGKKGSSALVGTHKPGIVSLACYDRSRPSNALACLWESIRSMHPMRAKLPSVPRYRCRAYEGTMPTGGNQCVGCNQRWSWKRSCTR